MFIVLDVWSQKYLGPAVRAKHALTDQLSKLSENVDALRGIKSASTVNELSDVR